MKTKILLILFCGVLLACKTMRSESMRELSKEGSDLSLHLSVDKKDYKVGDNIVLTLTWKNLSKRKMKIYFREDQLAHMIEITRKDEIAVIGRGVLVEFAPHIELEVLPGKTTSYEVVGKIVKKKMKEKYLERYQETFGYLVLQYSSRTLSRIPILIGGHGVFSVRFYYYLHPDSPKARSHKNYWVWTDKIYSESVEFQIIE